MQVQDDLSESKSADECRMGGWLYAIIGLTMMRISLRLRMQHYDAIAFVESFAEYVPAPCTHRPSSHPSEFLVKPVLSRLNQVFTRRAKS